MAIAKSLADGRTCFIPYGSTESTEINQRLKKYGHFQSFIPYGSTESTEIRELEETEEKRRRFIPYGSTESTEISHCIGVHPIVSMVSSHTARPRALK